MIFTIYPKINLEFIYTEVMEAVLKSLDEKGIDRKRLKSIHVQAIQVTVQYE